LRTAGRLASGFTLTTDPLYLERDFEAVADLICDQIVPKYA
jgi:hypothetical protein